MATRLQRVVKCDVRGCAKEDIERDEDELNAGWCRIEVPYTSRDLGFACTGTPPTHRFVDVCPTHWPELRERMVEVI